MMNPSGGNGSISFDPTRPDPGPQGSTPGQALQIIGLHLPKQFGRGIPDQLTSAPGHVGQTPEALVLASLLRASQSAGTGGFGTQPTDGVTDLLKFIENAMGGNRPPAVTPGATPPAPAAPAPPIAPPHFTPSTNFQHSPGIGPGGGRSLTSGPPTPMNSGGPTFGRG